LRGEAKGKTGTGKRAKALVLITMLPTKQMNFYEPIKEYREELMDAKRVAPIKFRFINGGLTAIWGQIVKMDTTSCCNRIEKDAASLAGTKQILKINGRSFENIC
jgi:hypothetical protein